MSTTSDQYSGVWNYPTKILFGVGKIRELTKVCRELKMTKPLLVTDKALIKLSFVKEINETLKYEFQQFSIFSDVKSNPTAENVNNGVGVFVEGNHDGVIALGGGSVLDAAKAIALMAYQTLPLWAFEDVGDNWTRVNTAVLQPVIAIPTTAGTGSEVGRASVITDEQEKKKKIIFHPRMMPECVIADPELTLGLNANLTAATGIDALSHNLEAFCALGFHPLADGIALQAMSMINHSLVEAVNNGNNVAARAEMLAASLMGATAFQKGLGAMHALAHPLGAYYDLHHGLLNAVLMPYVLKVNEKQIEEKMKVLAGVLSLQRKSFSAVLDWVLLLRESLGISHDLAKLGVTDKYLEEISQAAENDPSSSGNPKKMTHQDYQVLLSRAITGDL